MTWGGQNGSEHNKFIILGVNSEPCPVPAHWRPIIESLVVYCRGMGNPMGNSPGTASGKGSGLRILIRAKPGPSTDHGLPATLGGPATSESGTVQDIYHA